jgi:hypothetical protein
LVQMTTSIPILLFIAHTLLIFEHISHAQRSSNHMASRK